MAGYDVKGSSVYNKQGRVLNMTDLQALLCSICGLILMEAMQVTQCGHRFCRKCIETLMSESSGSYICPVDKEEFQKTELRRDRGCQKEIEGLEVDCPIQPHPCSWRGPLTEMNAHKKECPNASVNCSLNCGLCIQRHELASHVKSCPKRLVGCSYCGENLPWDSLEDHRKSCKDGPTVCDYCQEELSSRRLLENHLESECTKYEMRCPLECPDFQGRKPALIGHLQSHSLDMVKLILTTASLVKHLEEKLQEASRTMDSLAHSLKNVTRSCEEKDKTIARLEQRIQSMEHAHQRAQPSVGSEASGTLDVVPHVSKSVVQSRPATLLPVGSEDPGQTGKTTLQPLGLPAPHSHRSSSMRSEVGMEVSEMKIQFESQQTQLLKMNESLQTVQSHLTQYALAIDEVRLRQDVLDVKTTHGILVWKIPDIRRRYRDATELRTISLYSPPFYTSPHGYRMCIRTYLNGDGIGKGTHISVFFVLMRSEHDNLLSWPFKQSVRFTLINQKNPAASITEAFVPDLHSPSFKKPENDMNIASGFPKFVRQSLLQDENFTQDNVIYIKCQVDLSGLAPY